MGRTRARGAKAGTAGEDPGRATRRAGAGGRQVWDLRRLKTAVAAFGGLDNFFDTTAAVFGPGDEYFATGTSVRRARDGTTQVRAARVRSNWSEVIDRSLINEFTEV